MKILISSKNLFDTLKRISGLTVTHFRFIHNGIEFIAKDEPAIYLGCDTEEFRPINSDAHNIFQFDKVQWTNIQSVLSLVPESIVAVEFEFNEKNIIISQSELVFGATAK